MNNLRVGLVGAGSIARTHAPAWRELGAELFVFAPKLAKELAEEQGGTEVASMEELFDRVDVIDICSPTSSHADIATAALRADRDVVCEKPLTRTVDEGKGLMALAGERGRRLLPGHVVRYFPQYVQAKTAIDAGRVGKVAVLRFSRTAPFPSAAWFADDAASGGIILDQMIHDIDQAVWMAGPVKKVYATEHRVETAQRRVRTAHAVLTHESGAISHCRGLWGAPGTEFSCTFHVAGTGGILEHDSRKATGIELDIAVRSTVPPEDAHLPSFAMGANPYSLEIQDFFRTITTGSTPRVDARDGLRAVELSIAIIQSIHSGCPLTMSNERDVQ